MNPKVSVVIPSYNQSRYAVEAVESVIAQTFKDWELIVVDDASKDGTVEALKELEKKDHRIKVYFSENNMGPHKNMNRGFSLCKGEYIAKLDGDDYMYPDRLARQVEFMDEHKDVGVLGGAAHICDHNMKVLNTREYPKSNKDCRSVMFYYSPFCHPSVIIRRSVLEECGYYNPNISIACDIDLWFRLANITKLANLEDVIVKYRVHSNSISQRLVKLQELETFYVRLKAVFEYGYKMKSREIIYNLIQFLSVFIITGKLKFKLFNFLRRFI